MKIQKYFSLKIHQADLVSPTHPTFYLLCGIHRYLIVHIPPHKVKTVQTIAFIWVYFPQITARSSLLKTSPSVSIKSTDLDDGRKPSLPLSILSNIIVEDLEKSESGSSSISYFTYSITVLFPVLPCRWLGNITSHSPLTCSVLISGYVKNSLPPFHDRNLKPPDPLVLE